MFFLQNVFPFPLEDVFPFSWTCEKPVLWSYPTENKNVVSFFSRTCEKSVSKISRPLNIKKSCFFLEREKSQYGEYISSWKQVSPNTSQLLSCKSWGNWSFNRGDNIFRIKCREFRSKQFFSYQMLKKWLQNNNFFIKCLFTNLLPRHISKAGSLNEQRQHVTKTLSSNICSIIYDIYHSHCSVKARKKCKVSYSDLPLKISQIRVPPMLHTQEYQRHIILLWLQHRQYRSCKT